MRLIKNLYNDIPENWKNLFLFYMLSATFILLNVWLILKKDTLLGISLPLILVIFLLAIFSYQKLIWLVVFLTPLSIQLRRLPLNAPFDLHVPTEIIMGGIILLFFLSIARGHRIGKKITQHPVSLSLYVYLGWMFITSVTSTLPVVSLKYFFVHFLYVVIFYFLMTYMFRKNERVERLIWLYAIAFVPVIIYSVVRHSAYGLYDDNAAHWVMVPFFNDHTSYGAALAMFIPFLIAFAFAKWIPKKYKFWIWMLLLTFIFAEILSFTRAAWLSLFAAVGVWGIIKLKIKFRSLMILAVSVMFLGFAFQDHILYQLEQNSTDSSNDLMEHISSMTNITTDASNLERINRWQCAIAMFKEKPVFGWGPGTYAMHYAPFQLTEQRTIISTNSGDGGNAHSDYLGALSEMGLFGMLAYVFVIIMVLYTGINAYTRAKSERIKTLLLASVLALITYYLHGFLNNFLDTDKIGVPFWGFTAIIVSLDIYTRSGANTKEINSISENE
jgi:O-antigen ligase